METTLLVVELATPVLMDSPIHLDAIVASDLSVSQGDEAAMASLPQIFACTDDICHAGSFFFDATGLTLSVQRTGTVVGRKPIPPSVQPNPGTRGIYVTENRYKNHMNSYEATACYRAVAPFTGDVDVVAGVMSRANAIGKRRADGFGLIRDYSIEPVDADPETWGLIDLDGMPVRHVPDELWQKCSGSPQALRQVTRPRPFYWDQRQPTAICASPTGYTLEDVALVA